MIDKNKYSKDAFESIKHDSSLVRSLIEELQTDVTKDLQEIIEAHMRKIIAELNTVGHQLCENEPDYNGDTDFCEFHNDDSRDTCGFRLGTDLTVSAGYYKIGEEHLYND